MSDKRGLAIQSESGPGKIGKVSEDDGNWDLVIGSNAPLWSWPLHDTWQHRDLLYLMVRRDIVAFYKQTILGPLWYLIQPLMTSLVYLIVFGHIARLSTDGLPRILFYLLGVTLWNYFSECFSKTATVFRDNSNLFGKVYFPRIIVPLSIVISSLFRFLIQIGLVLLVACYYYWVGEAHIRPAIVLLPLLVALMAFLGLGFGMLFSALTTKYRDLVFVLQFGVQLLMYASPVIYPLSQVPLALQPILKWNPLTPIFESARNGIIGAGSVSPIGLIYSCAFTIVVFVVSTIIFNRVERTFMDTV